jgi:serine/threonine protein kinase
MAGALTTGMMFGPFTITEQIGRGGMGVVYAAQHRELQRAVALKLLGNDFNDSAEYRRRFLREAVALGRIDSPHIVQVYDAGELDGQLFIATKLYPKGDLRQWLTANGPLAPELAIALMDQVASGLQDAHDAGVVHRDVKPSNILLDVSPYRGTAWLSV